MGRPPQCSRLQNDHVPQLKKKERSRRRVGASAGIANPNATAPISTSPEPTAANGQGTSGACSDAPRPLVGGQTASMTGLWGAASLEAGVSRLIAVATRE